MIIDIKRNKDVLVEQVYELIVTFERQDITVWGNISDVVTQKCFTIVRIPDVSFSFLAGTLRDVVSSRYVTN